MATGFWSKTPLSESPPSLLGTNGAGTLFPPGAIPVALLDEDEIKRTCLNADDLWLKLLELKAGIPVVSAGHSDLTYIPGTQDCGLWTTVNGHGGNDKVLSRIEDAVKEHRRIMVSDLCSNCRDVFSRYNRLRSDSRKLSTARREQQAAERRAKNLEKVVRDKERAAVDAKALSDEQIASLQMRVNDLEAEHRQECKEIETLRVKCATYEERLKTPYVIRAFLNCARRIKRKLFGAK